MITSGGVAGSLMGVGSGVKGGGGDVMGGGGLEGGGGGLEGGGGGLVIGGEGLEGGEGRLVRGGGELVGGVVGGSCFCSESESGGGYGGGGGMACWRYSLRLVFGVSSNGGSEKGRAVSLALGRREGSDSLRDSCSGTKASATDSKQNRYWSKVCIIPPLCCRRSLTMVSMSTRCFALWHSKAVCMVTNTPVLPRPALQ